MVSEPFIRRPIATALLALAILLSGLAAFRLLPVSPLPRVDFPTISVSATLPGASPETMASAVATPLERRFGRIAGLSEMTSTSSLGTAQITLQFDLDRDVDSAARDVQAAINAAGAELPPDLPTRPNFRKVNPADAPILILSLTSKTLAPGLIADAATTILAQRISRLEGVGQVTVGGSQQPAVRVQADPVALAAAGMTLEDLRVALQKSTADSPKGAIEGGTQLLRIGANDQLFGADAFANLVVNNAATSNNSTVRVRDVARVIDSVENERVAAWTNGVRAVLIIVRRQPGANIVETNDRIRRVLPDLMKSVSPSIDVDIAVERTQSIRASVTEIEHTMILSIVLVLLVVFVFLRSFRATAIPSVVVPLSLVGTFGVMYLLSYSIDNLSLMALTIATGFVVDDAIVVTENISRRIEEGMSPFQASIVGSKEIGFTILSITTSLLAVFLPILLMQGIVGRLFREFAMTLSIAIVISMVISLTLTPMMCARLLRHAEPPRNWFERMTEGGFNAVQNGYARMLRVVLRHRTLTLIVTIGTVFATIALYYVVPKGLFPQQDVGMLMGFSEAPQDVSFPTMVERQLQVDALLRTDPDIAHVVSFVGGGPGGATVNTGTLFIDLRPERKANAGEIIARLRPKLAQLEGISVFTQAVQDVRVGGRTARTQYQYTLEDADLSLLRTWTPRLLAKLKQLPQLKDVASDLQMNGLELSLRLDRDDASRLGITTRNLDDTLYDAFGQRQVAVTYGTMNQYRVVIEMKPELITGPESVKRLYIRGAGGGLVPLETLVKSKVSPTPLTISHQGQFPSTTMSFNLAEGSSLGDAVDAVRKVEAEIGLPGTMHAEFSGTAQAFQASLKSEPWLILAALVTIYIVLGMLYESLIHPITIISTLPSAGVGALISLALFKFDLTIIALIGILLLLGIVKKNAIMMVDFAIEAERVEKLTPTEAIEKACLLRFRPIMMTTLAALLAAVALVVSRGVGSELRQPLGVSIVGGLIVSQALTLFTTPVVYLALERFSKNTHREIHHDPSIPPHATPPHPAE